MTTYNYESLGPDRFQEFCQALLSRDFPTFQALPTRERDGGRDGLAYTTPLSHKGFIAFQVKMKLETSSHPTDWLMKVLEAELTVAKSLVAQGAKKYIVLTNAHGTAYPESGGIDKCQELLRKELDIEAQVFWRADIDRRLEANPALKWSYPELLSGTDFLQHLVSERKIAQLDKILPHLRAFVACQRHRDAELKFRQAELQSSLLELFIDVPISKYYYPNYGRDDYFNHSAMEVESSDEGAEDSSSASQRAADFLLSILPTTQTKHIVLEGAPGQGKSTVTQYVAQLLRFRFLGEQSTPEKPERKSLWLPLRADLRDLASWLEGQNPFSCSPPEGISRTIETFLCHLLKADSGGYDFDLEALQLIIRNIPIWVFLDGLDEVAEPKTRRLVCEQIESAAARLADGAIGLRFLVTSRPAAFSQAPLTPRLFEKYSLLDIPARDARIYADKWSRAKRLSDSERSEISNLLVKKLREPHVAGLAKNTMQLAILLSLLRAKGESLPEKRTALYDAYVATFFDRESEKSSVVQKNRDLLVALHAFLAWTLHSGAEESGSGRISDNEFTSILRKELERQGHDASLVQLLRIGIQDRVMFLTSRVQGSYEFDVQPLREYFAAKHLFDNAPLSKIGSETSGTRLERFEELVRRPHWLNVARFFAGCSSAGELSGFADSIESFFGDPKWGLTSRPMEIGQMLLTDWVFAQKPRLSARVARCVWTKGAQGVWQRQFRPFTLPPTHPREDLIDLIVQSSVAGAPVWTIQQLSSLLLGLHQDERSKAIARIAKESRPTALEAALFARSLRDFPEDTLRGWFAKKPPTAGEIRTMIRGGRESLVLPQHQSTLIEAVMSCKLSGIRPSDPASSSTVFVDCLSSLSSVHQLVQRRGTSPIDTPMLRHLKKAAPPTGSSPVEQSARVLLAELSKPYSDWLDGGSVANILNSLEPLPFSRRHILVANTISQLFPHAKDGNNRFTPFFEKPARIDWAQHLMAPSVIEQLAGATAFLQRCTGGILNENIRAINSTVDSLKPDDFKWLFEVIADNSWFNRLVVTERLKAAKPSPRVAALLLSRAAPERRLELLGCWCGEGLEKNPTDGELLARLLGSPTAVAASPLAETYLVRLKTLGIDLSQQLVLIGRGINLKLATKILRRPSAYPALVAIPADAALQDSLVRDQSPLAKSFGSKWFRTGS